MTATPKTTGLGGPSRLLARAGPLLALTLALATPARAQGQVAATDVNGPIAAGTPAIPPHNTVCRVIFDTDIMGDVDDVGAVAMLHALADTGEAEILAMGVSSTNPWSPLCLSALNHYFGRPAIPVGMLKGPGHNKRSNYARALAEEFPHPLESAAAAPDAVALYRKTLASQADGSVVFISVGMLTNLRNLLQSPADETSPLTGRELVQRKVKQWVCMGGKFPEGREYNLYTDATAAATAVDQWPGPVVFSGWEIGERIRTGARAAQLPQNSPVRRAYQLYNGGKDRQSWDQTAVLFAVRGNAGDWWEVKSGGKLEVSSRDGSNRWVPATSSNHSCLVEKAKPEQLARLIDDLMLQQVASTVVVLPDTEVYCQKRPEFFEAQTRWIADHARARNIAYTLHLGDIVHDDVEAQWQVAKRCFGMLDGKVPYAFVLGNHDYADAQRTTAVNRFFPVDDFKQWPSFGGVKDQGRIENSYHLCRIGRRDWIILALEFGPRDEVVAWANQVLAAHPNRLAILVTHAYLFRDNARYDHSTGKKERASPHGWGNDGEQLWQKLVRKHANMVLVFSGHVATGGLGYLASKGDHGNTVHQIMVDYENMRGGGSAYLRLVEFLPDDKTVQVKAYSPALDQHLTDAGNQFRFTLDPAAPAAR